MISGNIQISLSASQDKCNLVLLWSWLEIPTADGKSHQNKPWTKSTTSQRKTVWDKLYSKISCVWIFKFSNKDRLRLWDFSLELVQITHMYNVSSIQLLNGCVRSDHLCVWTGSVLRGAAAVMVWWRCDVTPGLTPVEAECEERRMNPRCEHFLLSLPEVLRVQFSNMSVRDEAPPSIKPVTNLISPTHRCNVFT